ncbi:DMT family transporter [Paraburkholderia sp. BL17N1]|uniref:DMT family transporter n=1 Tax=Paraburkholderia sp. BL17N1 TaxID=1938798 RepID=UPI000EAE659C|nr:DMT family transporter [Paraburkholderia sp. BL17N1]RKR43239.1 EamA domain-containing membrane protein RarD [Paraburkholderia sp. BL17N1]
MTVSSRQIAALYAVGVFLFAVMDALAKFLSSGYPTTQIVFFRSLFGCLFLLSVVLANRRGAAQRARLSSGLLARGLTVVASLYLFFLSLRFLPLATATSLSLAAPLFMVMIGKFAMGERIDKSRAVSTAIGFGGVLLIVGLPGSSVFNPYSLIGIVAAFLYALSAAQSRKLSSHHPPLTIAFSTNLVMLLASGVTTIATWQSPPAGDLLIFLCMGVCGATANWIFSVAYQRSRISNFAVLEYTILIWAGLFGYVFFASVPSGLAILGMALIAIGGIYSAMHKAAESKVGETTAVG